MLTHSEIETVENLAGEVQEILNLMVAEKRIPPHDLEQDHDGQTAARKAYVDLTRAHRHLQRAVLNAREHWGEIEKVSKFDDDQIKRLEAAGVRVSQ